MKYHTVNNEYELCSYADAAWFFFTYLFTNFAQNHKTIANMRLYTIN